MTERFTDEVMERIKREKVRPTEQRSVEYRAVIRKTISSIKAACEDKDEVAVEFDGTEGKKVTLAYDGVIAELTIYYPGETASEQVTYEMDEINGVKKLGSIDPLFISSPEKPAFYTDNRYTIEDLRSGDGHDYTILDPLEVDLDELKLVSQICENPINSELIDKIPHLPRI